MDDNHRTTNTRPHLFQEITSERPEPIDLLPLEVESYVSRIEPKRCGKLIKELSFLLPLIKFDDKQCSMDETTGEKAYSWPPLGHLRRVRRYTKQPDHRNFISPSAPEASIITRPTEVNEDAKTDHGDNNSNNEPPKKRKKTKARMNSNEVHLEILFGSVAQVDSILDQNNESEKSTRDKLKVLISTNELHLKKKKLPGRPAKSQTELDTWKQNWWPSLYFEKQSSEYKEKEKMLDIEEEWGSMRDGLIEAIKDAKKYFNDGRLEAFRGYGAVVVDPTSQKVVSRSHDEWNAKIKEENMDVDEHTTIDLLLENPLSTPVMLCIQGVSRIERQAAMGKGMDSDAFKQGQYLCTGYDVYTTIEPGIFESMALVHSRVGRVIFGANNKEEGGLGGTGNNISVHCLPGTNHRYRAFRCYENEDKDIHYFLRQHVRNSRTHVFQNSNNEKDFV